MTAVKSKDQVASGEPQKIDVFAAHRAMFAMQRSFVDQALKTWMGLVTAPLAAFSQIVPPSIETSKPRLTLVPLDEPNAPKAELAKPAAAATTSNVTDLPAWNAKGSDKLAAKPAPVKAEPSKAELPKAPPSKSAEPSKSAAPAKPAAPAVKLVAPEPAATQPAPKPAAPKPVAASPAPAKPEKPAPSAKLPESTKPAAVQATLAKPAPAKPTLVKPAAPAVKATVARPLPAGMASKPAGARSVAEALAATPPKAPVAAISGTDDLDFDDRSVTPKAPAFIDKPKGKPDDLLAIKGIGPRLGQILNDLGIWTYAQIASWSREEMVWINAKIDFKGRVQREKWVQQARVLARKG